MLGYSSVYSVFCIMLMFAVNRDLFACLGSQRISIVEDSKLIFIMRFRLTTGNCNQKNPSAYFGQSIDKKSNRISNSDISSAVLWRYSAIDCSWFVTFNIIIVICYLLKILRQDWFSTLSSKYMYNFKLIK